MFQQRKIISLVALLLLMVIGMAFSITSEPRYRNLKVLPRDISERQLDSIMSAYTKALRVSCDFCHIPPKKDPFSLAKPTEELDFALDMPMKEEARKMIRLQIDINKKYFYNDSTIRPEYLNVVGCNTCHRGNPFPAWE